MQSLLLSKAITSSTDSKNDNINIDEEAPEAISTSSDDDDSTSTNNSSVGVASSSCKKIVLTDNGSGDEESNNEKEHHNIIKSSDTMSNPPLQASLSAAAVSTEQEEDEEGILILSEEESSDDDEDYVAIPFSSNELSNGFMLDHKVALLYQRCSIANSKRLQMFNTSTSNSTSSKDGVKKGSWKEELDEFRLFMHGESKM